MDQPPASSARLEEKGGFVVQVPVGDEFTVVCRVLSSEPHPRYGNGLFVLQQFPLAPPTEEDGIGLALALNGLELAQRPFGYGFGSYAARKKDFYFLSFLPNAVYVPGLLLNIYWSCVQRVQAVHAVLTSVGEEEMGAEPEGETQQCEPAPATRRLAPRVAATSSCPDAAAPADHHPSGSS